MTTEPKILVIDDEIQIQRALRTILSENHFRVSIAATGEEGLALAAAELPDVIVLDLGLPDMDGTVVCERLREWTQTPVIVLSAHDEQQKKVHALDRGADDYLTKPFSVEELLARVRVALRHAARNHSDQGAVIVNGSLKIDLARHIVLRNDEEVKLTATEFKLLAYLAKHADRVVTHGGILTAVWGQDYADQVEYLRVYMRQLRQKLETDPRKPEMLINESGVGYRFHLL